jgi:hypothetical protein
MPLTLDGLFKLSLAGYFVALPLAIADLLDVHAGAARLWPGLILTARAVID